MIKGLKFRLISRGLIRPKNNKGKKCIIMYHGIDKSENMKYNQRFFSVKNFEKQISFFKKNYNIVSLSDYFNDQNLSNDKLNIAITFDDGYQNNLLYAVPILEKYQAHATIFITGLNNNNETILWADLLDISSVHYQGDTILFDDKVFKRELNGKFTSLAKYIKSKRTIGTPLFNELKTQLLSKINIDLSSNEFLDYWKLLTPSEIQTMSRSKFVKVGSHGYYHNNLGNIEFNYAIEELRKSKEYLESLVDYEIDSIGYPDGSYTREVSQKAFEMGFKYQCAVSYKYEDDLHTPYINNRIGLYPSTTVNYINYQIQNFSI